MITDPSLTHSNVTNVLTSVTTKDLPDYYLGIPDGVREKMIDLYKDDGEQRQQFISYYLYYSPYSTSWTFLGGDLHYREKNIAEATVKMFVKGTAGVGVACVCVVM